MPLQDIDLIWKDRKGIKSSHQIRLFDGRGRAAGFTVCLMTESINGDGVSVTNGCDEIATKAVKELGMKPHFTYFIEHYERNNQDDDFSIILMIWNDKEQKYQHPTWIHINKYEAEYICGESI